MDALAAIPEWVVYSLAGFGALSLVLQLIGGLVYAVRAAVQKARTAAAWKAHAAQRGVWP